MNGRNKRKIKIKLNSSELKGSSSTPQDGPSQPKESSSGDDQNKDESKKSPGRESNSSPEPSCSICLGKLDNKSFTDSCFHTFCFVCLLEWSKVKAVCPLCKQPFTSIIHNVRSIEDYDQYPLQQEREREEEQRRFRYRTTITRERWADMQAAEFDRQRQLLQRPTARSNARMHWRRGREAATSAYRQRIYANNMRVKEVRSASGRAVRYREISPQFFFQNSACTHRLVPWLNRELNVLMSRDEDHTQFVLELILDLIKRFEMRSEEFREHIQPFVGRRTDQFIHEFFSFARSPYDMISYDRHAIYDEPDPSNHPVYTIDSDSDTGAGHGNNDDDDIIMLSDTESGPPNPVRPSVADHQYAENGHREPPAERRNLTSSDPTPVVIGGATADNDRPADSTTSVQDANSQSDTILNRVRAFLDLIDQRDTAHSGWESPLPGPSGVWYDRPENQPPSSDPIFPAVVAADVSVSTSQDDNKGKQKKHSKRPQAEIKEENTKGKDKSDGAGSSSEDSESDSNDDTQSVSSEHSSDVMVVGFEKPFEDRSPILLLSSDGEGGASSSHRDKKRRRHRSRSRDRSRSHGRSRDARKHKRKRHHERSERRDEPSEQESQHRREVRDRRVRETRHESERDRERREKEQRQRDQCDYWHQHASHYYESGFNSGIPHQQTPIYNWQKYHSSRSRQEPIDVEQESRSRHRWRDCMERDRGNRGCMEKEREGRDSVAKEQGRRSSSIEVVYDGPKQSSAKSKKRKKDKHKRRKHKKHKKHHKKEEEKGDTNEHLVVDTDNSASPTKSLTSSTSCVSSTTPSVTVSSPGSNTSAQQSDGAVTNTVPIKHADDKIGDVTTITAPSKYKKHPTGHKKSSKGKGKGDDPDSDNRIGADVTEKPLTSAEDILSEVDRICAESLIPDAGQHPCKTLTVDPTQEQSSLSHLDKDAMDVGAEQRPQRSGESDVDKEGPAVICGDDPTVEQTHMELTATSDHVTAKFIQESVEIMPDPVVKSTKSNKDDGDIDVSVCVDSALNLSQQLQEQMLQSNEQNDQLCDDISDVQFISSNRFQKENEEIDLTGDEVIDVIPSTSRADSPDVQVTDCHMPHVSEAVRCILSKENSRPDREDPPCHKAADSSDELECITWGTQDDDVDSSTDDIVEVLTMANDSSKDITCTSDMIIDDVDVETSIDTDEESNSEESSNDASPVTIQNSDCKHNSPHTSAVVDHSPINDDLDMDNISNPDPPTKDTAVDTDSVNQQISRGVDEPLSNINTEGQSSQPMLETDQKKTID